MVMQGDLQEMALPNLVQLILNSGRAARILIRHQQQIGTLYITDRQLHHAELMLNENHTIAGVEAVYHLLQWKTGQFKVERAVPPPRRSVEQSWDLLLMEGLRRQEESRQRTPMNTMALDTDKDEDKEIIDSLEDLLRELHGKSIQNPTDLLTQDLLTQQEIKMSNIQQTLNEVMTMDGALAAALVDWQSGMTLGTAGSGLNIELAAAGNTNVVRAKLAVMKDLKLKGGIEDILITLEEQYHLIRLFKADPHLFLYVALDRNKANLGLARHRLAALEGELNV